VRVGLLGRTLLLLLVLLLRCGWVSQVVSLLRLPHGAASGSSYWTGRSQAAGRGALKCGRSQVSDSCAALRLDSLRLTVDRVGPCLAACAAALSHLQVCPGVEFVHVTMFDCF
jgi:hypothetical protein